MRRVIFGSLQVLFAFLLAFTLYLFIKTGEIGNLSLSTVFFLGVYLIGRIKKPQSYSNNSPGTDGNDTFNISFKTALLIFVSGLFLPLILWLRGNIASPFNNPEILVRTYIVGLLISFVVACVVLLVRGFATK
jgi:hypothetical protein